MTDETSPEPSTAYRQEELLRHIANLAASVEQLAQRTSPLDAGPPPAGEPKPPTLAQQKARFAFTFLGELLGRREKDFSAPRLPRVTVQRTLSNELIFLQLSGGTAAKLFGRDGTVETLTGLAAGKPKQLTKIDADDIIDAIVVLENEGGAPLAIGLPCQLPTPQIG
jgi:hypothetical protein